LAALVRHRLYRHWTWTAGLLPLTRPARAQKAATANVSVDATAGHAARVDMAVNIAAAGYSKL